MFNLKLCYTVSKIYEGKLTQTKIDFVSKICQEKRKKNK